MNILTRTTRPADGRSFRLLPGRCLAALAIFAVAACQNPLDTVDPDIILPDDLEGPEAIPTIVQGAVGDFSLAYTGDATPIVGIVMHSGLFSDEWQLSGTFPTRIEIDSRTIDVRNSELTTLFRNLQRARRSAERAVDFIDENAVDPASATSLRQKAQMNNLAGYTYLAFGENFCSGVPFSRADGATLDFGQPQTTAQIYQLALDRFTSAAADAAAAGNIAQERLAALGAARTLLDRGDFVEAGAAAAAVPTAFLFNLDHSINSTRQENGIHFVNVINERWTISNGEGGNGLPFRSPGGALDVRLPWERTGGNDVGFDRITPQYDLLKYPGRDKLSILGTGIEARLIEAEAALQAGDDATWLQLLNDLRSDVATLLTRDHLDVLRDRFGLEGAAVQLDPLADPGSFDARVDLHFSERAFWLFATGQRLSDLRRLVRQYGRDTEAVFPTGPFFKGGIYGPDVNFPVAFDEQNNPNFSQCLDRDP